LTARARVARPRGRRWAVVAAAVAVFLVLSFLLARWLGTENVERGRILDLLDAQARGDAAAMLRELDCADDACREQARENARRLRARGEVTLVRMDSGTSHVLSTTTAPTRVVWITPGRLTTVQCVLVRRSGTPLSGTSVTLLGLSAPIGRESACS
jgi:hypothetical protein